MNALSGVRYAVRRAAARTRRAVLWTPDRWRTAVLAAVSVMVLVPVVSVVLRAPWQGLGTAAPGVSVAAPGVLENGLGAAVDLGATATTPPTDLAHDLADDLPGAVASSPGATGPGPAVTATTDPPVDAAPLDVEAVLSAADTAPPSGPAHDPDAASAEPTLSTDELNDLWRDQARQTAVRFARAWLAGATATSEAAWLRSLEPWLDPGALALVGLTNLAEIPRATATTVQLLTLTEAEATAVVTLDTGGRIDLSLVWDGESWRVTSYEPVPAPGVAAPDTASGSPTGP